MIMLEPDKSYKNIRYGLYSAFSSATMSKIT